MRPSILLSILALLMFATSSCGTAISNNASAASPEPVAISNPPETAEAQQAPECRICNYDFEKYKGELTKAEIEGLLLALNDEYMATATYEQVNREFGDPRPFVNIVRAEMRHADRLKELFNKYGVAIQENPWPGKVPTFKSVTEACKASVDGEIANRDLYTRLFKTTERQDIIDTYRALQRASEENHLPAFQRCGGGGGGRGPGMGRGPRGNG